MTDVLRPFSKRLSKVSIKIPNQAELNKGGYRRSKKGNGTQNGSGNGTTEAMDDGYKPVIPVARLAADGEQLDRRELLGALTALKKGDFTVRLPMGMDGLDGKLADTFNDVVELNQRLSQEFERLSRVVGKEGRISERAAIGHVQGAWAKKITAVNELISDLVHPTSETARVIGAVAKGDLSQTMALEIEGRPLQGEFLRTAKTVNTMVNQLSSFASEVTRVAREVGTEGKLGGQAKVKGVAGTWKDLTDSVNSMAGNLTSQVRNIAAVTTAVANGDLSKKITVDVKGEIQELKNTINTMVDQLRSFASEVTRVAREVGTEGKLGGQADVKGVAGTWKDLTDSVNSMAGNLTAQVRNIAAVTTAVANGDLSKKITVDVKGEILELKDTINTMVDQLSSFASEVTRVAREVGTEGKLGGQAEVKGVGGTWKDLTDSVNSMAGNLTGQVRNIAAVTTAVAKGDLTKKITVDVKGEILELKNTINTMVDQLSSFAAEVTRVAREVGTEGKLGGQADVKGVAGTWKDLTDNVNLMAGNLTSQVRNIADVTKAVAAGDLSKKITVDVKGEILELKNTVNTMVDQLSSFAREVTRVAREVGTEGKLGGQADVKGVSGTWKDLTDSVNSMAGNLTNQVRDMSKVATAIANGDLTQKITVDARGEILQIKSVINIMVDQLSSFAAEVTRVAREVGTEGELGGQADVKGAAGTWKDLTDNVNQLAANLTTQVRAIADVATAVTRGDLTRSITVAAQGEVAALKDNINEMIRNLKDTTQKNAEQDWLKTNLAKFSRMLQGQKDLLTVGRLILSELAPVVSAQQGVFYVMDNSSKTEDAALKLLASYAYKARKNIDNKFKLGEGLVGQCALEKEKILLTSVPRDYISITSGLGEATPLNIIVMPVVFEGAVKAVIELASFEQFSATHQAFLNQLTESIGIVLNTIEANMRTEDLLKQSQSLARELQSQQEELQQTNQQLAEKAQLLAEQNVEVERKNREVEQARQALEEKAKQLALTSKYKSEFLANMSHELRTPLNSLLILSDQLSKNPEQNLSGKQVDFARTIHSSGNDLLNLINDILDLSKIESGTVAVDVGELVLRDLKESVDRQFRHVAENTRLDFEIALAPTLPRVIHTDAKRLQQIIKNLLSNAFKFTDKGKVSLRIDVANRGWNTETDTLNRAKSVLAISVVDTGIGIPAEKQQIIFEAFQQADGSTSRKYGGTGLGLAISRELARLLGGEIRLSSTPAAGSTFTLYMPSNYVPAKVPATLRRTELDAPQAMPLVLPDPMQLPPTQADNDAATVSNQLSDDTSNLVPGERLLLIVENDVNFARFLLDTAHEHGFKAAVATRGAAALGMARELKPAAITLDINLPDIDGWHVLNRLKDDSTTRHIPVQIITTEEDCLRGLRMGAIGGLTKPIKTKEVLDETFNRIKQSIETKMRRVLVLHPDGEQRRGVAEAIAGPDVELIVNGGGPETAALIKDQACDLVVLDIDLQEPKAFDLIDEIQEEQGRRELPVIITSNRELTKKEEIHIKRLTQSSVVKDVRSLDRLVDEVSLFLHRPMEKMVVEVRNRIDQLHSTSAVLFTRKVLIVDDDIRNIFAMTSILEPHNMEILSAETGKGAIDTLQKNPDIDVVLMDIMMPDMDGYDTMRAIRKITKFRSLPIIALTAKAMKGDREKCIEAGASDYISKPVDTAQLLATMRVWLYR